MSIIGIMIVVIVSVVLCVSLVVSAGKKADADKDVVQNDEGFRLAALDEVKKCIPGKIWDFDGPL